VRGGDVEFGSNSWRITELLHNPPPMVAAGTEAGSRAVAPRLYYWSGEEKVTVTYQK